MGYFVDCDWLVERVDCPSIRILDCRFDLAEPLKGQLLYKENHLPNSVHIDLEEDLSSSVEKHGGRHPLPNLKEFKKKLEGLGIDNSTTVILYDDGELAFAARCWWLCSYIGLKNVYIVNGGFKEWKRRGFSLTTEIPSFPTRSFVMELQSNMIATYNEVYEVVKNPNTSQVLIDSREYQRYIGEVEPIDVKSGHIPGAINKVWTDGLKNGIFQSAEEQRMRFKDLDLEKEYIVYCGSGVTACPNYLALKVAGFKQVKLYSGSFSDWISHEQNKVETN